MTWGKNFSSLEPILLQYTAWPFISRFQILAAQVSCFTGYIHILGYFQQVPTLVGKRPNHASARVSPCRSLHYAQTSFGSNCYWPWLGARRLVPTGVPTEFLKRSMNSAAPYYFWCAIGVTKWQKRRIQTKNRTIYGGSARLPLIHRASAIAVLQMLKFQTSAGA